MKKIWKNYKMTIFLLSSLILGSIVGILLKERANILEPFGKVFINMMFVLIVPLIFLTITTSIAKLKNARQVGKLLKTTFLVFLVTSLVAVVIGLCTTYSFPLVNQKNSETILKTLEKTEEEKENLDLLNRTVAAISVNDFPKILSKENILALVIFSLFVGIAISKLGKEVENIVKILESANKIVLKLVDYAFYYAPIGLGCFFASLIGTMGKIVLFDYAKTFIIYTVVALLFYSIIYSFYAYIAGGKTGVKVFWKHAIAPSLTALSTCSSAATIPINCKSCNQMGIREEITNTVIPLGTSFHKDGSIIGSVFKIMFLVYLFQMDVFSLSGIGKVLLVSLIANLLVAAVPVGGGTISEMVIISMMGFPLYSLPILTIIATIIDAPATLLNVVGDTASTMLVARSIEGKKFALSNENNKSINRSHK